jgi:hypothetical protein
MMTRGSWVRVVKFVGVTGLVCGLLVVTALRSAGKRTPQARAGLSAVAATPASKISATKDDPKWSEAYGKLPLSFEENQGQSAREVRYLSHGSGYELFLTPQEAVLALQPNVPHDLSPLHRTATLRAVRKVRRAGQVTAIRLRLEGANPDAQIAGMNQLPGRTNYFIGNDPNQWHTDVPSYAQVRYRGIYPGVDLVFYGNQRRLEYDFVVAPGANPKAIAMTVDGARKMRINSRGDLVLSVAGGEVELQKPVVYQNVKGERREIAATYALTGNNRAAFNVGSYDRSAPLILDPVLNYSTYLGGSSDDGGFAIAVDGSGNAFIAGQTKSADFPHPAGTLGGVSVAPTPNSGTSFVAELDATGTKLLYSTYLAGSSAPSQFEQAFGIAVDTSGKVYVTGVTFATNFPTTSNALKSGPIASNPNGTSYISKLDPTLSGLSSLLYSSYLGGTNGTVPLGGDIGQSIAVDSSNPANGIVYVAGYTDSTAGSNPQNFPVVNGFQPALACASGNAFLAKIDTTKSGSASLLYSTYLGGTCAHAAAKLGYGEDAYGVAVDASGNAYLAGVTTSIDFPTSGNAYQRTSPAGNTQGTAFVTQIDTTQSGAASKIYSTYFGGAVFDQANAIALGPNRVAYVTGTTNSNDFPTTPGAFDTLTASSGKAFVTLIDTAATGGGAATKKYSTFLGGTGGNAAFGIQADAAGNAYVAGTTGPNDFPFPPKSSMVGGFQPTYPVGARNVGFIAKLNPTNGASNPLLYSTYFGGIGTAANGDQIFAIAIDSSNPPNVYATGQTFSTSATFPVFPTAAPAAFQQTLNGTSDAFVAKLTPIPTLAVAPTTLNFGTVVIPNTSPAQTVTLTNNTNAAITFTSAAAFKGNPPANPPVASTDYAATNTCGGSIPAGASCNVSVTFKPSVVGPQPATLVLTDGDSTSPQNIALTGTGANPAPAVGLAPTSLAFGNQLLNTTSAAQTVTLTNTGTGPLTINSIAGSGDFAGTSTGASACPISPATLAVNANCTISVTFTPTATGARAGTLTITDNATGSPHTVSLTGTGTTPVVGLAPTSLTFGNQLLNTTSAAQTVTLTNTGTGPLTIISIAASGDFAKTSACPISPATLAAGANCVISVTFTPTATGARAGTLTITDNATPSTQTVGLTGTGTNPPPDFGLTGPTTTQNVTAGSTLNFNVTMTPMNGFTGTVALRCDGAPTLSTCTVLPTSVVAPNGTTAQNAQVSLATTALMVPPTRIPTPPVSIRQVVPVLLAMLLLFLLPRTQQMRMRFGMVTAMVLLLVLAGCGGGKAPGTTKGPATLTITGTSGTLTPKTVQVPISVN